MNNYNIKLTKTITLLFFLLPFSIFSQQLDHVLGDILVQINIEKEVRTLTNDFQNFEGLPTQIKIKKVVVPSMNIWLLNINHTTIDEVLFLEKIKRHPIVINAQFNHLTKLRSTIPNDPEFWSQWQYLNDGSNGNVADADIDADLAWDITTGGLTANGDTIVVCIIDAGIDPDHEDIKDNLWINHNEIPNNGIDDDNNGFTDDYRGWNSFTGNDNVYNSDDHGTSVSGIIGAKGNNNIGVTGVNWDVKMMIVRGGSGAESEVLISYSYALSHRKKYNETNGAEGAFVVVTNSSWGVDEGMASDFPLWCAFYDSLGMQGIINCGATANDNFNVEVDGDMPTTCTSDFLIGVTNLTSADIKHPNAGFGNTSIDLGAPGALTWTVEPNDNYGLFAGTSASTPHVAGAVALLYSAPCSNLPALALNDPPAAALQVKNYILDGIDPVADLDGITVTGGRLNVFNSVQMVLDSCGACPAPSSLTASEITDVTAVLSWNNNDSTITANIRYRELPNGNWIDFLNVVDPLMISGLKGCTDYEAQVESVCASEESGFVYSYFFKTEDCCLPPTDLSVDGVTSTSVDLSWTPVFGALNYYLELTPTDSNLPPILQNTPNSTTSILSLMTCTEYQVTIQIECDTGFSIYSNPITFETSGCGTCKDLPYCAVKSDNADSEWIANVTLGSLDNTSAANNGYGDFTELTSTDVDAGTSYTLSVAPGYSGNNFSEFFKVWIDYNQDGDFDDFLELVLNTQEATNMPVSQEVLIPSGSFSGSTRMRVMMLFSNSGFPDPDPCEDINFGEIEDYCLNIIGGDGTIPTIDLQTNINNINIFPNPFSEIISVKFELKERTQLQWELLTVNGKSVFSFNDDFYSGTHSFDIPELDVLPQGVYFLKINTGKETVIKKIVKQ